MKLSFDKLMVANKLTVGKKLIVGFSILIILIAFLGTYSSISLGKVNSDLNELYDMHLKGVEYVKNVQISLTALRSDRNNLIISENPVDDQEYIDKIRSHMKSFDENLDKLKATLVTDGAKDSAEELSRLWDELVIYEERVIEMASSGNKMVAKNQSTANRSLVNMIEEEINTLVRIKSDLSFLATRDSNQAYIATRNLSILIVALSVVVGILITIFMSRTIARPIVKMANMAGEIADGNLSVDAIVVKNTDEIGDLASSFNIMIEEIRKVISSVLDASQQVAASSQELSASSEETTAASEEIAGTINQLAMGASKQAEDATETYY